MIDRAFQKAMLEEMEKAYPHEWDVSEWVSKQGVDKFIKNIAYLKEHNLVRMYLEFGAGGFPSYGFPTITAKGIDFLADDGGLSAILGTVTVKIHATSLYELLSSKIDAQEISPEEKASLKKTLKTLPEKGLEELTNKLVSLGVDHLGDAASWLQRLLESLQ